MRLRFLTGAALFGISHQGDSACSAHSIHFDSIRTRLTIDKFGLTRAYGLVDPISVTINTENMDLLNRLLGVATMRHNVIAQNIANVNTPGFQTLAVSFEDALQEALASGAGGATSRVSPQVVLGAGGAERADGNNVDIDLEVGRLQKNTLYFKVYTQLLATQLAQFRSAIAGR